MAKYTTVLNANTTGNGVKICDVNKKRALAEWRGLLMAYGTFGGGTLTWFLSPDNGTNVIAMTDLTDASITMTSNKAYDSSLTTGSHNSDHISIYVQLSGSTAPSLTVSVYDNNG